MVFYSLLVDGGVWFCHTRGHKSNHQGLLMLLLYFLLSGGWCIKKVIRNPTPTPKPRRKTKQTKKRVEKKPKSGISFELVLLKWLTFQGHNRFSLEWTGKYELRKYKFKCRYYHCSCNRHLSDYELSPKKTLGLQWDSRP